jgi:hypothetical protein
MHKLEDELPEGRRLPLLGMARAAKLSGFSVRHFRRVAKEQQIRVVHIGRKSFILTSDLIRWAKSSDIPIENGEGWTIRRSDEMMERCLQSPEGHATASSFMTSDSPLILKKQSDE